MKYLSQFLIIIFISQYISCKEKIETPKHIDADISYELQNDENNICINQLIAYINGHKNIIIPYSAKFNLNIHLQDDFNNDGVLDILLEHRKGCHSTGEGQGYLDSEASSYFIMTFDGQQFHQTEQVGNDWDGIYIETKNDTLNFTIDTELQPYYRKAERFFCNDKQEIFKLDGYELKRVSVDAKTQTKAIREITSDIQNQNPSYAEDWEHIEFDFDGDGKTDMLEAHYDEYRKGFEFVTFTYTNNDREYSRTKIETNGQTINRVGVLETKTKGFNDVIINCGQIYKWNGKNKFVNDEIELRKNTPSTYRVFAKNGLIIRDKPGGEPIGKFDYGTEIIIHEKTDIEMSVEEEEYVTIDGYWYATEFLDTNNKKKYGFVFSGYIVDLENLSIYSRWDDISISRANVTFYIHGQCIYSFLTKIINDNEVELIWSPNGDCVFDAGFYNDFGLTNVPEIGKPFAKYTLNGETLSVTYYYPEWTNTYSEGNGFVLSNSYTPNYPMLIDY